MREKKMLRRTAAGMIAAVLMAGGISTAYAAETPGLSLGNDGAVAAEISLLQPDSTYYFPVQYTREDGRLVQVRASAARSGSFSLRLNSGASQSISASGYTDRNYSASSGNLSFSLSYSGSGVGYLDYIEVNVWRDLTMTGAYMTFHNRDGLGGYNRYRLNAGSSVRVWDINDLTNVAEVPLTDADGVRTFVDDAFTAKSYVAVDLSAVGSIPSATLLDEVTRQAGEPADG